MVPIANLQQDLSACSPYILDKHTTRNPLRDCEVPVSTRSSISMMLCEISLSRSCFPRHYDCGLGTRWLS
jgi:hypothetical protein